jgi:hypothetical protein
MGLDHDIRDIINEIQYEISFGQSTIKKYTRFDLDKQLHDISRYKYKSCGNYKCQVCESGKKYENKIQKGYSKATIKNEEEYIRKKEIPS